MELSKSYASIHWDYFLLLEKDLNDILDSIEPCEDNLQVYGPKLAKLLLATGSEIDVSFKELIKLLKQNYKIADAKADNINDYKKFVQKYLQQEFDQVEVGFARSRLISIPWSNWWKTSNNKRGPNDAPLPWWNAYNQVKHHRVEKYNLATLENVLDAIAALFTLIGSLARAENKLDGYRPPAILEFYDNRYGRVWIARVEGETIIMGNAPNFRFEPIENLSLSEL